MRLLLRELVVVAATGGEVAGTAVCILILDLNSVGVVDGLAVAGLPVDQHLGNLEGKEMRFRTSAGAIFSAVTVDVTCGAVNAEHDSLNPFASLAPMTGMWLNCIFGGKGVGMINPPLFLVIW
jgi:K+-transporting ATPase A subunit